MYTVYYILHCILFNVYCSTLYFTLLVYCILYTFRVYSTLYMLHCTEQCKAYSVHIKGYSLQYRILYCTLNYTELYSVLHSTVYSVQ